MTLLVLTWNIPGQTIFKVDGHPFKTCIQSDSLEKDTSVFGKLPEDLGRYYNYINLAARAIYNNNFELASLMYDTAFLHKEHPFYVDLENYVRVNYHCQRQDKNNTAIYRIITEKHVDTLTLFTHLPRWFFNEENLKMIRNASRQHNAIKREHYKSERVLRKIWESDQEVRDYDKIPSMTREEIIGLYARRDSVDSINVIRFKSFVNRYGFPEEETLGVFLHDSLFWNTVLEVLLLHFLHKENDDSKRELISMILEAVHDGKWNSSLAASLLDRVDIISGTSMRPGQNFMYTSIYLVLEELYRPFVFYSDSLMQITNLNRIAFGLDSFHIAQRQAVCQYMCAKMFGKNDLIIMQPWADYAELPPGLVKRSAEEANVDAASFRINTEKILSECPCEEKRLKRY